MTNGFKGLRVYNTLTRAKEDFVPIDADRVRMYVCGPTVYDYAHIGNARPAIVFDILFRLLRHLYGEDHVTYVRNITDVDDKINARARRDYPDLPLNEAIREVTQKTADQYHADVAALGCLRPTIEPRATEFVLPRADGLTDMASLIQTLMDRGHAYEANGEILFDTASMPAYGGLSKRKLEDQQAGARIAVEAHKKNPADFVLWKQSSADEPGWDAQFTIDGEAVTIRGRPGWHIECSAMSAAYLGEEFDIHGGGLDLIFPHHENEIAQSCCAHGRDVMARYWMHNGFLQVEGRKMSKSEGNFVTINQLLETEVFGGRSWPGEVLRLAMLMTHYREPIDFSVRKLEEAEAVLDGWYRAVGDVAAGGAGCADMVAALSDDLGTTGAIAALHELRSEAAKGNDEARQALKASAGLLGLLGQTESEWFAAKVSDASIDTGAVETAVEERLTQLREKNFAEADRIRDELTAQGVQLMDYKDPESGERRTKWEVKR
ncbi:cysteine--tRNA ligase [Nitratireductor aquimarinus]|uniref:cysteine--tRNA ligase n=1 Tax=Alphaproteobacteria TaxID=28211 RepID=UPI0019D3D8AB|nr:MULTISPECIES: cysteine--tRNA ligase [Alphaproteobacteria]MBN7756036.1 cysteine--tRNA ligase [Nitratireductor aquimarinus]MBY5998794.1 cysteine--tRNA ligase [Tritonibacter mobilis]MBY6020822.1 cysteine--tRNA ligase [Nitratireductor sp. DP7N14-4]